MYKFIALALLVATTDASKLHSRHSIPKQHKHLLAQLMQPNAKDIMQTIDGFGNGDGQISLQEFKDWLDETAK